MSSTIVPRPPDVIDGVEHYTVEAFMDSRFIGKGRQKYLEYLVRWEGYSPDNDEWVSAAVLQEDLDSEPYKALRDAYIHTTLHALIERRKT